MGAAHAGLFAGSKDKAGVQGFFNRAVRRFQFKTDAKTQPSIFVGLAGAEHKGVFRREGGAFFLVGDGAHYAGEKGVESVMREPCKGFPDRFKGRINFCR